MQLMLELCDVGAGEPPSCKVFDGVGGVIGRGAGCDWVIPDPSRLLSSHHGLVSCRDGQYFLTDISSNGIRLAGSGEALHKGQAHRMGEGDVFQLGALAIRARLVMQEIPYSPQTPELGGIIPDDAYLDPVYGLARQQMHDTTSDELDALRDTTDESGRWTCRASVERDHVVVPTRAQPFVEASVLKPAAPIAPVEQAFWAQFSETLGVCLDTLDMPGREALAIKVASLFKQAIDGLQQSLRTHDELKSEFDLGSASSLIKSQNPLKDSVDVDAALSALLGPGELGRLSGELAISQAYRDIQVHQIAVLVASRTVVRNAWAGFAPGHLLLCFERQGKPPRFAADGAHWRAYRRHYQQLTEEGSAGERQLHIEFAKAYDEQVRLVSTLYAGQPG